MPDEPQRISLLEGARVTLCAGAELKVGGRKCRPDVAKAFVEAFFGGCLPVVTAYGQAMLPGVVARSFRGMEAQVVNLDHQVRSYAPDSIPRDRIIGGVFALEYPDEPEGGWRIPESAAGVPLVRTALSIYKAAEGVNRVLGAHQASRREYTVSLECRWYVAESAWCWRAGAEPVPGATDLGSGWEGLAWADAPAALRACWGEEANAVTGTWEGRRVVHLMGGLDGAVEFTGIALVERGAEPTAEIRKVLCAAPEATPEQLAALAEFLGFLGRVAGLPDEAAKKK